MKRPTIAAISVLLAALFTSPGTLAHDDASASSIEGTWVVHVTPPKPAPPYDSLASFASGGVVMVTPDPVGPMEPTSTGQGVWRKSRVPDGGTFHSIHAGFAYLVAGGPVSFTYRIHARYRQGTHGSHRRSASMWCLRYEAG